MKKIIIMSLFLFGQQVFSEVIPSSQLTGAYQNQSNPSIYIVNEVEKQLDTVNNILCYLHSLRSESFVNKGDYKAWTKVSVCDIDNDNPVLLKTIANVRKTDAGQVVKVEISVLENNIEMASIKLKTTIRASATEANPLGDLTLNWETIPASNHDGDKIHGVLEVNNEQIQLIFYENDVATESIISNVKDKKGSFTNTDKNISVGTFAFNDDFIKTNTACFDRNQSIDKVWEYTIYTYTENTSPTTEKLKLEGIQPFSFKYKNASGNIGYGDIFYNSTHFYNGGHPTEITSTDAHNHGVTYTVEYTNNHISKLTTNGIQQSLVKPIEFDVYRIQSTDIRSNEKPDQISFSSHDRVYITKGSRELSLKDGAVLFDKNGKKYVVKANIIDVEYKTTESDRCADLVLPAYKEPEINYAKPDTSDLSATIEKISVIDGVIQ